ncbi:MAG: cupredoxin domain-containing protein [Bacillota bacterium]
MLERKYRWWIVAGAFALVFAGGALFSRYAASAAPGTPWGYGGWTMGQMHAQVHGGNPAQASQWMAQMHNAMWLGSSGSGTDRIPQEPARPDAPRVEASVSIKEWKMEPASLAVSAGSRLVLTIRNDGASPHHFVIPTLGLHIENLAPGASKTVELNADKAGAYPYFCDIPGHAQLGQQGTLTITQAN